MLLKLESQIFGFSTPQIPSNAYMSIVVKDDSFLLGATPKYEIFVSLELYLSSKFDYFD